MTHLRGREGWRGEGFEGGWGEGGMEVFNRKIGHAFGRGTGNHLACLIYLSGQKLTRKSVMNWAIL